MTEPATGYSTTFTVTERNELEPRLDHETAEAIAAATSLGVGLVVTRHDANTFTIAASPEVPPGLIHERDLYN
uniref:hypothetical protein n=1 Tax=Pigmentiphaga litoralis TaxID=516702 RepID=UPI003899AC7D